MRRLFGKDDKGFSLVEVLCALAIMSLVSITVGTVVVVSARTYRNGVSETSVQQEAQLAANTIGNIIKDASKVVYYNNAKGKLEDGQWIEDYSGNTKLTIVTNQNKQYDFIYDDVYNTITYTEVNSDGTYTSPQLLANNIDSFTADTADFKDSRSVTINLSVKDETTGRQIPLSYTMYSRNEVAGDVTYVDVPDAPVIIFLEDMACIIPGESVYRIPVYVSGNINESQLRATYLKSDGTQTTGNQSGDALKIGAVTTSYVEVYIDSSDYNNCDASYKLTLQATINNASGDSVASADCTVYVRTVTKITTTYSVNTTNASDKNRESKGAVYKFTAAVEGYNLAKFNRDFDLYYQYAYSVYWSYEFIADGITYKYDSSKTGSAQYTNQSGAEQYLKITSSQEDVMRPTFEIILTNDMPSDFSLTVTATSKHAKGLNKANIAYATATGDVTVSKINDLFEVTLEPNETQKFDLGDMIDSVISPTSTVSFKYFKRNSTDTAYRTHTVASGTGATYLRATNQVAISIGNDEIGYGYNEGDEPYTFYIGIYVDDKLASIIKVHVRRIDFLHVKIEDSGSDVYDVGTVYHFKVRYNATTDSQNDMIIKYLINTTNINDIKNALAVNLSWAIKDESATDDVEDSDLKINGGNGKNLIVKATVDKVVVEEGWSMTVGIKDNQEFIKTTLGSIDVDTYECKIDGVRYDATVKHPMVRIYYEDDAMTKVLGYSMVQAAELDIRLEETANQALPKTSCKHIDAGTPNLSTIGNAIGLSANKKLVVKAVAMHPYAAYNRGHADYVTDVEHITDIYVLSQ